MEYLYKFFEYAMLYVLLVLIPALIRVFVDTAVIKIPSSSFQLPPSRTSCSIKFEDAYASVVSTALVAPLFEEIVFRGTPYLFFGTVGLVIGSAVWVLAHPSWQLRYITGLPLWKRLAFTINSIFYYSCAAIFFSLPWIQGYPIFSVLFHMLHNGAIVLGGIFSEVEFPAPWKREDAEFFREPRGLKKKLEEKFFKDTNPPENDEELEEELDVDLNGAKFFKEFTRGVESQKHAEKKATKPPAKVVAKVDEELWSFWVK